MTPDILSNGQMKQHYGEFYYNSPKLRLDPSKVPEHLRRLLPYAEFWGIADDLAREILVKDAPSNVRLNLKEVVSLFEDALEEWLVRTPADKSDPSDEYVAFAAMIMAADYV